MLFIFIFLIIFKKYLLNLMKCVFIVRRNLFLFHYFFRFRRHFQKTHKNQTFIEISNKYITLGKSLAELLKK